MAYKHLLLLLLVVLVVADVAMSKRMKKKKLSKKAMMEFMMTEMRENLTALWEKVDSAGPPVHVHVEGAGHVMESSMHTEHGTHVHIHLESGHASHEHSSLLEDDGYFHAQCNVHPESGNSDTVKGTVFLKQKPGGPVQMKIALEGIEMSGRDVVHEHGFHVHQYGDLSGGCATLGGHFNPHGTSHGGDPNSEHIERHAGDWGNVVCDDEGKVEQYMEDDQTSLFGEHSIVGRGIVIHEHHDDLGLGGKPDSLKTGGAGGRMACCVITWHPKTEWVMPESAMDASHSKTPMRSHAGHRH